MDKKLNSIYSIPEHPASFSGLNTLRSQLDKDISVKDVKKWLQTKDSYTLHKPLRRKFKRNRVIVAGLNKQFQADLVDMQSLSVHNDGYKYLLTCIDILSKYAWAIPLKDKKSTTVKLAFEKIFFERIPQSLQTDAGKEFTNKHLQSYLKEKKINFFTTHNETKASVVERFNRTLKTKMWKYFTEMNTKRYIDVVQKLVKSYNHTWHSSIKTEPVSVTSENERVVWNTLYSKPLAVKRTRSDLQVGDTVRISRDKMHFEKGYEQNWTREIFEIYEILPRKPIVFKLRDLSGDDIKGSFYKEELQKVSDSGYYPVEKVLRKRKRNGKIEYFVKFLGYPEKFNDWVDDVRRI